MVESTSIWQGKGAVTIQERGERFRALHNAPGVFVIPNPWDIASARILAGMGFKALATSSAASACAIGRRDGQLTRDEALAHARLIVEATDLPVSGDLEHGFGHAPPVVAETVRMAGEAGLVGCTIEDTTGDPGAPLFDRSLAVERIAAAAEAARALPFPFMLTARAHSLMFPGGTLDDTIDRLRAFDVAGADVLFAPGLPDLEAVRTVCASITKPFNFMAGIKGRSFAVADLEAAGVKRISLATSLYRAAMTGFVDAAREIGEKGTFEFLDGSLATGDLLALMQARRHEDPQEYARRP
jgi:2-methylisocitrate lyase-like PEP mutase family enzyme